MKKFIYALIIPLLFITRVSAEGLYSYDYFYDYIDDTKYIYENYQSEINESINYLQSNFLGQYSDYVVMIGGTFARHGQNYHTFKVIATTSNVFYHSIFTADSITYNTLQYDEFRPANGTVGCTIYYKIVNGNYISSPEVVCGNSVSRTPISYTRLPIMTSSDFTYYNLNVEATLEIPSYTDSNFNFPAYTIGVGNNLPTYETLIDDDYIVNPNANFITIDLKQYDYIILSLKNYNITGEKSTPIYTLGQLCITRVNDYGMQEVSTTTAGYQTAPCTSYYSSSTPVNLYIQTQNSILVNQSKPVWYIKSPADERPNTISVDTSVFNISYITSSNSDNPTVDIGGRSYPVIPYEDLTDTAIKSTNEGYISGQVCVPGDVNCEYETGIGLDISDIFTQPLTVLENVWASITSVFLLITKFIILIPSPLKEFLIASFMLAVVLGLIKIIL